MPFGLAISFFFMWVYAGLGSPAGTVRVMACKDTHTIRRSIVLLGGYNMCIYIPLILICVCGRALVPDLPPSQSDEIVPRLAVMTTRVLPGGSLITGLILSAPFGAVMATVSTYLVVIASGVVRDIYQRFIRPGAGDAEIRRVSHAVMILLGLIGVAANINPVQFLQKLVVFSTSCTASTFVAPAMMLAFWRRATATGVLAAMFAGSATVLALFTCGVVLEGKNLFDAYQLFGVDPIVWGLLSSSVAGVLVSLMTEPPPAELVSEMFDARPGSAGRGTSGS
jgi:SSS family solute:Na+ symporter/sodium/pantothenate symporter